MPSDLATRSLRISYRTGQDDLVKDFFVPCLEQSVLYRRAAGYFTSSGLAHAARGVASLVARGGRMRLVASPCLTEEDATTLSEAMANPDEILRRIVLRSLEDTVDCLAGQPLNALAWLAASGALEIRLALRLDSGGKLSRGIFHEKAGIFSDESGNDVAFAGSANETAGGLVENFESLKVFWSWDDPHHRVQEEIDNFEALWANQVSGLKVIDFTLAGKDLLERYRQDAPPMVRDDGDGAVTTPKELRDYQLEALRKWLDNGGRGILAMATGTGKTKTALHLARKLSGQYHPFVTIVVCPYLNLLFQWQREIEEAGHRCLACCGNRSDWQEPLRNLYQSVRYRMVSSAYVLVTNSTFLSATFQTAIKQKGIRQLLVADEVHNLGAENIKKVLPEHIDLRLGLSATPERHYDEEGTQAIKDYFGKVVFEYGLKEAIEAGYLSPYHYHPVLVDLTPHEAEQYLEITQRLSELWCEDDDSPRAQLVKMLLIKRARLLASAGNKIDRLRETIHAREGKVSKAIFYCGDGRVGEPATDEDKRQIKAITELLGDELHLKVRQFTFEETSDQREDILGDLRADRLDGLVAIRCLDEGIDVPEVRLGFLLASSTNPRQFIQRRGRLLRKAPGKEYAEIYDFIVKPPDLGGQIDDDAFNLERRFFQRELRRIIDFCETAANGAAAKASLLELRKEYNLLAE